MQTTLVSTYMARLNVGSPIHCPKLRAVSADTAYSACRIRYCVPRHRNGPHVAMIESSSTGAFAALTQEHFFFRTWLEAFQVRPQLPALVPKYMIIRPPRAQCHSPKDWIYPLCASNHHCLRDTCIMTIHRPFLMSEHELHAQTRMSCVRPKTAGLWRREPGPRVRGSG